MDEMATDATFTDPLETDLSGAELHEDTVEIFEAFPDIRLEVKRVISADDGATAIECDYVGTQEGSLEGIPPTGKSVVVPSMTVSTSPTTASHPGGITGIDGRSPNNSA